MGEYLPSCPNFNGDKEEMHDFNNTHLDCADSLLPNTPSCKIGCTVGNMFKAQQCLNNAIIDELGKGTDIPPQIQADWTETNSALASYIRNKPELYSKQEIDNKDEAVKDYVDSRFENVSTNSLKIPIKGRTDGSRVEIFRSGSDILLLGNIILGNESRYANGSLHIENNTVNGNNYIAISRTPYNKITIMDDNILFQFGTVDEQKYFYASELYNLLHP